MATLPARKYRAIVFRISIVLIASLQLVENLFAQATATTTEIPFAAPEAVGMSSGKLSAIDDKMQSWIRDQKLAGGIVIIARKGRICFFEDYGMMNRATDQAMRKDAILRFYSMTKAITSAAIMMLYEEGGLKLDDDVALHIPSLKGLQMISGDKIVPLTKPVTIRDLLRHSSGISYGWGGNAIQTKAFAEHKPMEADSLAEMCERLQKIPVQFEPGSDWVYGVSIDVLGHVVERVSGKTLDVFFKERFFDPLDMPDTGFSVPDEKLNRFAANYKPDGDGLAVLDDPETSKYRKQPGLLSGGGGLVSTARDYMRFLMMIQQGGTFQGKQYLKPETVRLMTTNQLSKEAGWVTFGTEVREGVGFGLGFNVRDKMSDWDAGGRVGEYGWGGAASTHYWVSPKDELIVITLEQTMPYTWTTEFGLKKLIYDAIE